MTDPNPNPGPGEQELDITNMLLLRNVTDPNELRMLTRPNGEQALVKVDKSGKEIGDATGFAPFSDEGNDEIEKGAAGLGFRMSGKHAKDYFNKDTYIILKTDKDLDGSANPESEKPLEHKIYRLKYAADGKSATLEDVTEKLPKGELLPAEKLTPEELQDLGKKFSKEERENLAQKGFSKEEIQEMEKGLQELKKKAEKQEPEMTAGHKDEINAQLDDIYSRMTEAEARKTRAEKNAKPETPPQAPKKYNPADEEVDPGRTAQHKQSHLPEFLAAAVNSILGIKDIGSTMRDPKALGEHSPKGSGDLAARKHVSGEHKI